MWQNRLARKNTAMMRAAEGVNADPRSSSGEGNATGMSTDDLPSSETAARRVKKPKTTKTKAGTTTVDSSARQQPTEAFKTLLHSLEILPVPDCIDTSLFMSLDADLDLLAKEGGWTSGGEPLLPTEDTERDFHDVAAGHNSFNVGHRGLANVGLEGLVVVPSRADKGEGERHTSNVPMKLRMGRKPPSEEAKEAWKEIFSRWENEEAE